MEKERALYDEEKKMFAYNDNIHLRLTNGPASGSAANGGSNGVEGAASTGAPEEAKGEAQ